MNSTYRISTRLVLAALLIAALVHSERASAAMPEFDADGWYTWRVQAAQPDTLRCCGTWSGGRMISGGCNLDTGRTASGCADFGPSDEVQLYARVEKGHVTGIRAFSPQCRIESTRPMYDLGPVENGDSVSRLKTYVATGSSINDDALAAIASHAGVDAFEALRDAVRDEEAGIREQALFWLVQSESDEAFEFVEYLITGG